MAKTILFKTLTAVLSDFLDTHAETGLESGAVHIKPAQKNFY